LLALLALIVLLTLLTVLLAESMLLALLLSASALFLTTSMLGRTLRVFSHGCVGAVGRYLPLSYRLELPVPV